MPAFAALIPMLMFVACNVYDNYPVEDEATDADKNDVTLLLKVGLIATTRADADIEQMHSLRVVLLDEEGKVEYNDYINSSSRPDIFSGAGINELDYSLYRRIITKPGKKKIFLISNEESVTNVEGVSGLTGSPTLTSILASKGVGDEGFEDLVNSIYFKPDFTQNIVISSMYEFDIPKTILNSDNPIYRHTTFWMVRGAAKFQFFFENNRSNPVYIDELQISSVAEDTYLMPQVGSSDYTKDGKYWIDWLKQVCEETNEYPDDPENNQINQKDDWITHYTIPPQTQQHIELDVKNKIGGNNWTIPGYTYAENNEWWSLSPVYCAESRNMSEGSQNYTFSIKLSDNTTNTPQEFTRDLNLPALFRNTFVRVYISLHNNDNLEIQVMLTPWDELTSGDISFN